MTRETQFMHPFSFLQTFEFEISIVLLHFRQWVVTSHRGKIKMQGKEYMPLQVSYYMFLFPISLELYVLEDTLRWFGQIELVYT